MAGVVQHDATPEPEPISPELAMIDPELARRHALMPAVWETVRLAQEAARQAPEPDDRIARAVRGRRGRWLLVAAAAAIAGAGVLAAVGAFRHASSPATRTAATGPPHGQASAKRVRSGAPSAPPVSARLSPPKRHVAPPAAGAPPASARAATPTAPTATPRARTKPTAHPEQRRAPTPPLAQRAAAAPPATAKTSPPAAAERPAAAKATATPTQPHRRPRPEARKAVAPFTPRPQTLVWKSVPGATGYTVAVFKGSREILVRRTRATHLTVPRSWRYSGTVETLAPGRYQWWVWFARGRQSSGIVVRSTLVISR